MRIFHIATAADWATAQRTGRYTTSTRGRSLAEEGFVHAARGDQWQGVRERFYADVTEALVLLVIDTDRLSAPVVEEAVPDSSETFPHVYGAIEAAAVVQVLALDAPPEAAPPTATPGVRPPDDVPRASGTPQRTLFSLFLEELSVRAGLGLGVMVVAVLVGLGVVALVGDVAGLVTMVVLLLLGLVLSGFVVRRRERRIADKADSRS